MEGEKENWGVHAPVRVCMHACVCSEEHQELSGYRFGLGTELPKGPKSYRHKGSSLAGSEQTLSAQGAAWRGSLGEQSLLG